MSLIKPSSTTGPPVLIVHRQKGSPEAYIVSKKPRGYICGLSLVQSQDYMQIVSKLKLLIEQGKVTTKAQAKEYVNSQV